MQFNRGGRHEQLRLLFGTTFSKSCLNVDFAPLFIKVD